MKELTDRQAGEIIAHWRRKPTADDKAMVRQIVGDALKPYKKICTVKFRVAKSDIPTLGYGSSPDRETYTSCDTGVSFHS